MREKNMVLLEDRFIIIVALDLFYVDRPGRYIG